MFKLSKINNGVKALGIAVIILFAAAIVSYFTASETLTGFLIGLLGIAAMLTIALQTFLKMDESTKKTIKTIARSSKKQIEEFGKFVKELRQTNTILESVSESLNIVSEDVVSKQKQIPKLCMFFSKNHSQITLRAGEENQIEIRLCNLGEVNAGNPCWRLYFPPEIEIVNKGSFDKAVVQGRGYWKEGYTALFKEKSYQKAGVCFSFDIKIKTQKTSVGLVELLIRCSCNNVPVRIDKLLIDFIG